MKPYTRLPSHYPLRFTYDHPEDGLKTIHAVWDGTIEVGQPEDWPNASVFLHYLRIPDNQHRSYDIDRISNIEW